MAIDNIKPVSFFPKPHQTGFVFPETGFDWFKLLQTGFMKSETGFNRKLHAKNETGFKIAPNRFHMGGVWCVSTLDMGRALFLRKGI